jgi:hypothetical protein
MRLPVRAFLCLDLHDDGEAVRCSEGVARGASLHVWITERRGEESRTPPIVAPVSGRGPFGVAVGGDCGVSVAAGGPTVPCTIGGGVDWLDGGCCGAKSAAKQT